MTLTLGLRFVPSDARLLFELAARVRNGELAGHSAGFFAQAANMARTGEPLLLQCEDPVEAVHIAAAFAVFGVTAPVIESFTP